MVLVQIKISHNGVTAIINHNDSGTRISVMNEGTNIFKYKKKECKVDFLRFIIQEKFLMDINLN